MKKAWWLMWMLVLFAGIGGFFTGKAVYEKESVPVTASDNQADDIQEKRLGGYRFISPLLECDQPLPSEITATGFIEQNIADLVQRKISSAVATHVSVYFRDLNNGPWFGVGENDNFSPASLMKVPIMMAVFKKAERSPPFLKKQIVCKSVQFESIRGISDSVMAVPGRYYTVEEMVTFMIVHSDNRATISLLEAIGLNAMDSLFTDLQIVFTKHGGEYEGISLKEYSSFYRILFNASYLSRDMSEKALELLTQSTYKNGLVAALPADVPVAHKFGERGRVLGGDLQLHEIGIVYVKKRPYLLGIMTRGNDFDELGGVIAEISKMVYDSYSM